jgi:putative Mg2+ transporter-C (MgtC) family protein
MATFFGIHVPPTSIAGMTAALLLSVVLGALVGLERELHGHPAGLRTHILVCLGATLMTVVSKQMAATSPEHADPARLAAQIVAGIGFLGAGAIVREGATIRGLTTAASIWTTAGLGIAVGASPLSAELAIIAAAIVLFTLWTLQRAERWLDMRGTRAHLLDVHIKDTPRAATTVLGRLASRGVRVRSIQYEASREPHLRQMMLVVNLPPGLEPNVLLSDIGDEPGVQEVHLE